MFHPPQRNKSLKSKNIRYFLWGGSSPDVVDQSCAPSVEPLEGPTQSCAPPAEPPEGPTLDTLTFGVPSSTYYPTSLSVPTKRFLLHWSTCKISLMTRTVQSTARGGVSTPSPDSTLPVTCFYGRNGTSTTQDPYVVPSTVGPRDADALSLHPGRPPLHDRRTRWDCQSYLPRDLKRCVILK